MYGLEVITPPAAAPVPAADLRAWLRTSDTAEDALLTDLLGAAVDLFEHDTGRPVLATTYRQYLSRWPGGLYTPALLQLGGYADWTRYRPDPWRWPGAPLVLGRGGVTAVAAVRRYLADGTTEAIDPAAWHADLATPPARVYLDSSPPVVTTAAGVPVSPAGYVEFTAGWPDPASTPTAVKTAVKLLAAHWYTNREAFREGAMAEVPVGWTRVVARYRTGVSGDWGQ